MVLHTAVAIAVSMLLSVISFLLSENYSLTRNYYLLAGLSFLISCVESDSRKPALPYTALEYFFDSDPGKGLGTPISFTPIPSSNILINPAIDLENLSLGIHTLYIRAKNINDQWTQAFPSQISISCDEGVKLYSKQSGNWNSISTWACGRIPKVSDKVFIKSPHTVNLPSGQTGNIFAIDTQPGATLNIQQGSVFKIN